MAWFSSMLPYLMQWLIFPALVSITKIQIAVKIFSPEKIVSLSTEGSSNVSFFAGEKLS